MREKSRFGHAGDTDLCSEIQIPILHISGNFGNDQPMIRIKRWRWIVVAWHLSSVTRTSKLPFLLAKKSLKFLKYENKNEGL